MSFDQSQLAATRRVYKDFVHWIRRGDPGFFPELAPRPGYPTDEIALGVVLQEEGVTVAELDRWQDQWRQEERLGDEVTAEFSRR